MEYTVKFNFNCINKRSLVSGKSGEVDITSDAKPEDLKISKELIRLITADMARKTKQTIISVEITDVRGKIKNLNKAHVSGMLPQPNDNRSDDEKLRDFYTPC